MDDASLDDFLDSDDGTRERSEVGEADESDAKETGEHKSASADATGDETADAGTDAEGDAGAVEPATTTYQWTPTGATCAACGEQTERRWESDEGLVCPDCKGW
jgi:NADH pyrophosphatase NudC (nudix superfamily)